MQLTFNLLDRRECSSALAAIHAIWGADSAPVVDTSDIPEVSEAQMASAKVTRKRTTKPVEVAVEGGGGSGPAGAETKTVAESTVEQVNEPVPDQPQIDVNQLAIDLHATGVKVRDKFSTAKLFELLGTVQPGARHLQDLSTENKVILLQKFLEVLNG